MNICIQLHLVGFLQPRFTMHETANIKITKYISHVFCAKHSEGNESAGRCVIQIFEFQIRTSHHVNCRSFCIVFIFDSVTVISEKEFQ